MNCDLLNEILQDDDDDEFSNYIAYFSQNPIVPNIGFLSEKSGKPPTPLFSENPGINHIALFYCAKKIYNKINETFKAPESDDAGRTYCHFAAAGGNEDYFKGLSNKEIINLSLQTDKIGCSYLYYAAAFNRPAIIEWSLSRTPDLLFKSVKQENVPARVILTKNFIRCVEVLVRCKLFVDKLVTQKDGSRFLLYCLNNGSFELIPYLIRCGLNINKAEHDSWPLILHGAKASNDLVLGQLLRYGVNVEASDICRWTSLHVAASYGRVSNVEKLIEYGANPFAQTSYGSTPFMLANIFHPNDQNMICATKIKKYLAKRIVMRTIKLILEENEEEE